MNEHPKSPSFARWLRSQREKRHWTQQRLADHFKVTKRTVQRWESGEQPQPHSLEDLENAFQSLPVEAYQEWSGEPLVPEVSTSNPPVNLTEPETSSSVQTRPYVFMAPDYPRDFIVRKEFATIRQALLSQEGSQLTALTAALRGAGGYGKTTLATAICHDPEIKQKFSDGILFVILGEKSLNIIGKIEDLLEMMGHKRSGLTSLEAATTKLREALKDRSYLLCIDDVWHADDLAPFLQGGPHCTRLVTTRNNSVLPRHAHPIPIDAMRQLEAMQLLQTRTGNEDEIQSLEAVFWDLAALLGEWPLLLSLANGVLRRRRKQNESLQDALDYLQRALKKRGVVAFDEKNATARTEAVAKTIEISLEQLTDDQAKRYSELAIFPPDANIPFSTILRLWETTGGLDNLDTEELCQDLANLSLVSHYDLSTYSIRLHDVMCNYLQTKTRPQLSLLHQQFLNTYTISYWADLPDNEPYLWEHLIEHLLGAERKKDLLATMKDIRYLSTKVTLKGASYVEQDFYQVAQQEPDDALLVLLKQRVEQMAHLLRRGKTPLEVGGVIVSSLCGIKEAEEVCTAWEQGIHHPSLLAWHPLPEFRDSALRRTFMNTVGVSGCAINPDGTYLASASNNHMLKIWDIDTGKIRHTLIGHREKSKINTCAFSPDGRWLVSASSDGTLKIWNAITGELRRTLADTAQVNGCVISPDGTYLVSAGSDKTLKVWDFSTGEILRTLTGHTKWVNGCAMSPDGTLLASASTDGTLKIWDFSTGEMLWTLSGHIGWVYNCVFSPNSTLLASAGSDKTLKLWDLSTGEIVRTLTGHTGRVHSCAFSPDGSWLVSSSSDHTLKIWNVSTGEVQRTLIGHADQVKGCAISQGGNWLVSASNDGTLKIWDTSTEKARHAPVGHTDFVNECAISPDGSWLVSASNDKTLKIWDLSTGEITRTLTGHADHVVGCAISPDGTWLVSASDDKTLKIWSTSTGEILRTLIGHTDHVKGCAISPDGTWLVSASDDNTLKIWNVSTGEIMQTLTGHTQFDRGGVNGCIISSDGTWLVSASDDNTLKTWNLSTGKVLHTFASHTGVVCGCAISPDGTWLISASTEQTLKIWDVQSARCTFTFYGDGAFYGCCIHPDSKHIIAAGKSGVYFLRLHK